MTAPSQPPPGFGGDPRPSGPPPGYGDFVRPTPVYGVQRPDGTLAQAPTVADAAAAARARVDAAAGIQAAPTSRRVTATLIDYGFVLAASGGAAYLAVVRASERAKDLDPIGYLFTVAGAPAALIAAAPAFLIVAILIRVVWATVDDGATPGRRLLGMQLVSVDDAARLGFLDILWREVLMIFYAFMAPLWLDLLTERFMISSALQLDGSGMQASGIPHDRATASVVARRGEVARVRAHAALDAASAATALRVATSQAVPAGAPGGAPAHGAPAPYAAPRPVASSPYAPVPPVAPSLSAAPFIPAGIDPEVEAARQRLSAAGTRSNPRYLQAPELPRRIVALIVDLILIGGIGVLVQKVASAPHPGLTLPSYAAYGGYLVGWLLLRPIMLGLAGATLGQRLMRYHVVDRRGERIRLGTAFLRETVGWVIGLAAEYVLGFFFGERGPMQSAARLANADMFTDGQDDPRMPHDRFADTWPIRD